MINKKNALDIGIFLASQVFLWYGVKWVIGQMDPLRKKKDESASRAKEIFSKLQVPYVGIDEYEQIIANEIILPGDISVSFSDIGGLDDVCESLKESVLFPLLYKDINGNKSNLFVPPKGVLMYGPPGCGKTLIAKALARESNATFINLHVSTLTEKWYGESQKLVKALFSLAIKLQPAIIFIDEIDAFLRERSSYDHEVTGMMKAEFMSLWDGLASSSSDRVVIIGATNRLSDIDKAILRRMPQRFSIELPNEVQRSKILEILLSAVDIDQKQAVISYIVSKTDGFSGSDLKEICRHAVVIPMRESMKANEHTSADIRPLTMTDFRNAFASFNKYQ